MITPTGFQSWKEYFSFVLAREYISAKTGEVFIFKREKLEKLGSSLSSLGMKPLDFFLKEIRNPLMLVTTTASALFITSILYYPSQTGSIVTTILPFLKEIEPYHVRAFAYGMCQSIILGLGMRAYGRLENHTLMEAFKKKEIIPISIGTHIRR